MESTVMTITLERSATSDVTRVEDPSHLCAAHDQPQARNALHASFLTAGLACHQRSVFVSDELATSPVLDLIEAEGFDVSEAKRSGALMIVDAREIYGSKPGRIDPVAARAIFRELAIRARADGFVGLRTSVELHSLAGFRDLGQLLDHERVVNDVIADEGIVALCQYEPDGFAAPLLEELLGAHHAHV